MDYTSIHIYGHLLSDDVLHSIEQDVNLVGNREQDFGIDASVQHSIDYVWTSLRNDWRFYKERSSANDLYGTRRARDLMESLFSKLGYVLSKQVQSINIDSRSYDITYLCHDLKDLPIIVIGDKTGDVEIDTLDKCSLDFRAKGKQKRKSPHATMLEYLNNTESVYGIVANGQVLRLIRNTGQLVKLTYIEFDLRRMLEEDKYSEFCLMFRLLHCSRFKQDGDEACVFEKYFNLSIESGNRIRNGLSRAVQSAMETIGRAVVCGNGDGNDLLRQAIMRGELTENQLNKELIHFIYRILFLFIIEERNLVHQIPSPEDKDYSKICKFQEIYKRYYAVSRLRASSEISYMKNRHYEDIWQGLMETFRLFEEGDFGDPLGIKPLGGVLFGTDTLKYIRECRVTNADVLNAFTALNEFNDERGQRVKINYSSLDVEEFGSVYEGILEMRPYVKTSDNIKDWEFGFVGGLDRQSTSSYYTRPDLVQNLIRTTLEPVIKEKIKTIPTAEEKVKALLNMKVCDAASGSGHIVLAMARTIAWYVCTIRTGEDNPASLDYREALREVIQKCVYAVDYNPDAVELCKVVLWIEGYCAGKPLSFLDHHIRCGNSVVGVSDLDCLLKGVPKDAFSGEDTEAVREIKSANKRALDELHLGGDNGPRGVQKNLFDGEYLMSGIDSEQISLASDVKKITELPENTLLEAVTKQKRWEDLMESPRVECLRRACDIYTYAFYKQFCMDDFNQGTEDNRPIPYTRTVYRALEEIKYIDNPNAKFSPLADDFKREVEGVAKEHRFFHWCVEFPEVFAANGGFDVMCGNPPWDKLQMEDEKWFAGKDDAIVNAANQSKRKKMIAALEISNPQLYKDYLEASHDVASQSNFVKNSGRFSLSAVGKIDLYPLFAELCLTFSKEAWGLVVPIGLINNDSCKLFFGKLIEENRLKSIYCFENKEKLFDIDSTIKFCLLTAGNRSEISRKVNSGFYLTRVDHLLDPNRIYHLKTDDFSILNPNTKTCPIFRTSRDADLTTKIYKKCHILLDESSTSNPWKYNYGSVFNMSTDSGLFYSFEQLSSMGATYDGTNFILQSEVYVPLYEGKMIYLYNHHYGEFPKFGEHPNNASLPEPSLEVLQDVNSAIIPYYWIKRDDLKAKDSRYDNNGELIWQWPHKYKLIFKDVGRAGVARTFIIARVPNACGIGNTATLILDECGCVPSLVLQGMMSSLVFDYVAKQKAGGNHMSKFIVNQLPVLFPDEINSEEKWEIIKRVAELCYFNHDLDDWAEELWEELDEEQRMELPQLGDKEPFVFDTERRAVLQAELDAIFAHLYGLDSDELRYILDPEDICGQGCINETFRVLKDNEIRQYGEYRTKRLVLEAWNKFGYGQ